MRDPSDRPDRDRLVAAYAATHYLVRDGDREIAARIGVPNPAIDALLEAHGAASGTFITAWNPGSAPRPPAENAAAAARMAAALAAAGRRWLPHEGRGDGSDWRESGFFVLDLPEPTAIALATRFGQNAVVRVERGSPPRLLFTALMPD